MLAKYDASRLANCPGESDISVIQMKNPQLLLGAFIWIRQRPTLPGRLQPSTIGAERLNFCVRDGNRWIPFAIATGIPLRAEVSFLRESLSLYTLKTAHLNFFTLLLNLLWSLSLS